MAAPVVATPPDAGLSTRRVSYSLRQLGVRAPMQLRGTTDLQGVLFGVRGDEVVTQARLVLQGAASPALIPELSQIAVSLNEQFIGAIQPDRSRPNFGPLEFPVNPVFFADTNRLNFRFSGRYAVECNDPLSGLLWSTISDTSALHLLLEKLPPTRDLARLPEPFFDQRMAATRCRCPSSCPTAPETTRCGPPPSPHPGSRCRRITAGPNSRSPPPCRRAAMRWSSPPARMPSRA